MNRPFYQFVGGRMYALSHDRPEENLSRCDVCHARAQDCMSVRCLGGHVVLVPKDSDEYLTARLRGEV